MSICNKPRGEAEADVTIWGSPWEEQGLEPPSPCPTSQHHRPSCSSKLLPGSRRPRALGLTYPTPTHLPDYTLDRVKLLPRATKAAQSHPNPEIRRKEILELKKFPAGISKSSRLPLSLGFTLLHGPNSGPHFSREKGEMVTPDSRYHGWCISRRAPQVHLHPRNPDHSRSFSCLHGPCAALSCVLLSRMRL